VFWCEVFGSVVLGLLSVFVFLMCFLRMGGLVVYVLMLVILRLRLWLIVLVSG